jgi:signal transduction histidine kinase
MLRNAITHQSGSICVYDLQGTVLAAVGDSGTIFLQDASGNAVLELKMKGIAVYPGQKVRLRGTNYVTYTDIGISLGTSPLVDNDNEHSTVERMGEVFLKAGRHPIRVAWFNWLGTYFLQVSYSGPQITRQTIPATSLFRTVVGKQQPGLEYGCFEGPWEKIPDFDSLTPNKTGVAATFDDTVRTRDENIALNFKGFIEIPEDGYYKFYVSSDDGSQLFLDDLPPEVDVVGKSKVPAAQVLAINQLLPKGRNWPWAEIEGTITFMSQGKDGVDLELASGGNQMQVKVLNSRDGVPWYLLNSVVRIKGICPDVKNSSGQENVGSMAVSDWGEVEVLDMAPSEWNDFRNVTIGELNRQTPGWSNQIVCLHGRLQLDPKMNQMELHDQTGLARVELLSGVAVATNSELDCLGRWTQKGGAIFLNEAVARESSRVPKNNAQKILTTALQVQELTREEAERDYPVEIQGVVTWVSDDYKALIVQDSTRAVFVWAGAQFPSTLPHASDYCKIEGVSQPADFSPIVILQKATVLWRGKMPPPVTPTRDQLLSGSLDAQYVEIGGLVIATQQTLITLLTSYGILDLDVMPSPEGQWTSYLNSFVRVRGCLRANWDPATHRVMLDQPIHLLAATVSIDSAPPTDLFEADLVRAADLLRFDVQFDPFRRVKVRGQIIHCGPDIDYLMDGATGLRFQMVQPLPLKPGDEVEVVGLVKLEGNSPLLRQAVARKIGHTQLPLPRQLSLNEPINNCDSTLVSLQGTLVDFQEHGIAHTLEIQAGVKSFMARLDSKLVLADLWPVGSRLKLTGTFCALDGDRLIGRDVNSFELLLNSPQDVQIIARPPWWTLNRLLVTVACLVAGLTATFVWIGLLRHQVGRRTRQLEREISERERVEKMRAIEHERSRIARDLHDDLGSTLTEISMMATARPGWKMGVEITAERLQEIAEKSRSMISALDSVVWVVNSKNDTLSSLIEYLASYAEEFLANVQIACRVEMPKCYTERIISSETRHDVMLAVREALNNAVRHGRPSQVLLLLNIAENRLKMTIQDNGCGFKPAHVKGNGLVNLHQRMGKLGGSCEILHSLGGGTTVVLQLPLPVGSPNC